MPPIAGTKSRSGKIRSSDVQFQFAHGPPRAHTLHVLLPRPLLYLSLSLSICLSASVGVGVGVSVTIVSRTLLAGVRQRGVTQSLRREPEQRLMGASKLSSSCGASMLGGTSGLGSTSPSPLPSGGKHFRTASPGTPKVRSNSSLSSASASNSFTGSRGESPTSSEYSDFGFGRCALCA
jgi:hypothetical protein